MDLIDLSFIFILCVLACAHFVRGILLAANHLDQIVNATGVFFVFVGFSLYFFTQQESTFFTVGQVMMWLGLIGASLMQALRRRN